MTGSAALSYQNIKVIAEYASTFESLEAFRSASVEEWESTVLDHEPIPGGSGYISYQDNHQARLGSTDSQSALGAKFSTKSSISCGLRRSQPRRSTPQSTDQECRQHDRVGDNGPFRPNRIRSETIGLGGEKCA